jgi:23S rRNA pseudouridine955/2504/2580 synthase
LKFIKFADLIIFEDENLLVVNKPAHLSSLEERNADDHSPHLLQLAKTYCKDAQLCHRLDKETSGVLIIAKNNDTYKFISMQFEQRKVDKIYHAVVEGVVNFNDFRLSLPIGQDRNGKVKIDHMKGKKSDTIFDSLKYFRDFTLMQCRPVTGRLHQIRVHLASQNAPIVSDLDYGGHYPLLSSLKRKFNLKKTEEEQPMIKRVALHAYSITFARMGGGELQEPVTVTAPYPKDMAVFIKLLEKYNS